MPPSPRPRDRVGARRTRAGRQARHRVIARSFAIWHLKSARESETKIRSARFHPGEKPSDTRLISGHRVFGNAPRIMAGIRGGRKPSRAKRKEALLRERGAVNLIAPRQRQNSTIFLSAFL